MTRKRTTPPEPHVAELKTGLHRVEGKVDALGSLEPRVAALEPSR
jgi:hypothetical protein